MMSSIDDKLVRAPSEENQENSRDNVIPLTPRIREKAADRTGDQPARDADEDDPGPSAA